MNRASLVVAFALTGSVVLTWTASCGNAEGVCGGSSFGTPGTGTNEVENARCDVDFANCGPDGEELSASCDDGGHCTCFKNGDAAGDFDDADLCDLAFATAEENNIDQKKGLDDMRKSLNAGCGFDVTAVQ
jgi:hypothetical protein